MGKNTNKIVSLKNPQNKTKVNKIRLEETNQLIPNSNAIGISSKSSSFVHLCKEKNVLGCDGKKMHIFRRLSETGWQILLFRKIENINLY